IGMSAFFSPADGLGCFKKSFFHSDALEAFSPIRKVAVYENILQTEIQRIHSKASRQIVHMLFAGPCGLRHTIAAERSGHRFVRVNSVAVYFDMGDSIRPGSRKASFDANRWTFLCVSAGPPINPNITRDERTVSLYAAFDVNDRFMTRDGRD